MQSPEQLLRHLSQVFPDFKLEFDELDDPSQAFTYHHLMHDFLIYWGTCARTAADSQTVELARVINESVSLGGDIENAVDTCFLEHLSQVRGLKPIEKYLSPAARLLAR
jgi:ATP/maltotriose-dependent transcriptional regulator MalT